VHTTQQNNFVLPITNGSGSCKTLRSARLLFSVW